jgi:mono/diheme cytochrome c family protein
VNERSGTLVVLISAFALLSTSCRNDMYNQPKKKPLAESIFFKDGTSARPLPANVVPRNVGRDDPAFAAGLVNGIYITQLPVKLAPELLARGRERYDIYCATCHGLTGNGDGMVVRRGFPAPPSYHLDRLRNAPVGYFYDVMANGFGVMSSYGDRVKPQDRWAIAAYIRALQLSQNARPQDVPPNEFQNLQRR